MTIRIPPETVLDTILRYIGKERQVVIPQAAVRLCNELGPHVQVMARRESFFTALFRIGRSSENDEGLELILQRTEF
jgi:hypothetical protein